MAADHAAPITGYGWAGVRTAGDKIFAGGRGSGRAGIWRLDPTPVKIVDVSPDFAGEWRVFRDRVIFPDDSDPQQPRLLSVPFAGGTPRVFAEVPGMEGDWNFAINPRTAVPVVSVPFGPPAAYLC